MSEQEYVRIELTIRKDNSGIVRTDRLLGTSNNLSEKFKKEIWENYSIDIDYIPKTENCEIFEKLKHQNTNIVAKHNKTPSTAALMSKSDT